MVSARRFIISAAVILVGVAASLSLITGQPVAAQQQSPQPGTTQQKAAPLKPGDIDARRSRVYVKVDKTGLGHTH